MGDEVCNHLSISQLFHCSLTAPLRLIHIHCSVFEHSGPGNQRECLNYA